MVPGVVQGYPDDDGFSAPFLVSPKYEELLRLSLWDLEFARRRCLWGLAV